MINEFRTLLVNLPYNPLAPAEHLSPNYPGVPLPPALSAVYSSLFSGCVTRQDYLFTVTNLLTCVAGTPYEYVVYQSDPRVTYLPALDGQYFTVSRNSTPIASNPTYPMNTMGSYTPLRNQKYTEILSINQISNTAAISINSAIDGQSYVASATLSFASNGLSQWVQVGYTGVAVQIDNTDGNFTTHSSMNWQVMLESPRVYNALNTFNKLNADPVLAQNLFATQGVTDTTGFQDLWYQHPNSIYRLAGLLICYVDKVNYLL